MKGGVTISLSVALAFGAFVSPHFARAVDTHSNQMNISAQQEAAQMVTATVNLKKGLDARKLHPGDHFEAVLQRSVQLKNGPKLDRGTVLMGTVTEDQLHPGNARLAFSFNQAKLKNGQTIPVKAMVVELATPLSDTDTNVADQTGLWSAQTLQVDQINALSGVDLHSAIGSSNSAMLVSKKDDVTLGRGSQIVVAIAKQS